MSGQYNLRNPAVKRLMKEAQELREPTEQYFAQPLEDNLFEWHFTIRGPGESEFDGGIYHGRIILPPEYPMKPPSIMLLTPNGRFETFKKICLSISGHHPESWQPSWSIRTALLAIIGFMPTHGNGAIGSLDYTPEERKVLAKRSNEWKCPECGSIKSMLKPVTEASKKTTEEAKELASQINFQGEKEKNGSKKEGDTAKASAGSGGAEGAANESASPPTSPEGSGAAGAATPTTTPGLPPFTQQMFPPTFPGMMPPNMPPFMPRMMAPAGGAGGVPPFMRPYLRASWPGMMPPMPAGGAGAVPPGGMYRWPAMMNPQMMAMMNPQMMAMMGQQMGQQQATGQPAPVPAAAPSPTVSPPVASTVSSTVTSTQSTSTTSTATSRPAATPRDSTATSTSGTTATTSSTTSPRPGTSGPSPASPSNPEPSSSSSPTPSQTPSTTTPPPAQATAAASTSGLRQRRTEEESGTGAQPSPAAPAPADQPPHSQRRGENPMVVMVMALLGLLIIALILRRLYNVVNAGAFDNDF